MPYGVPHSVGIDHGGIDVGVELEFIETVSLTSSSSLWISTRSTVLRFTTHHSTVTATATALCARKRR